MTQDFGCFGFDSESFTINKKNPYFHNYSKAFYLNFELQFWFWVWDHLSWNIGSNSEIIASPNPRVLVIRFQDEWTGEPVSHFFSLSSIPHVSTTACQHLAVLYFLITQRCFPIKKRVWSDLIRSQKVGPKQNPCWWGYHVMRQKYGSGECAINGMRSWKDKKGSSLQRATLATEGGRKKSTIRGPDEQKNQLQI